MTGIYNPAIVSRQFPGFGCFSVGASDLLFKCFIELIRDTSVYKNMVRSDAGLAVIGKLPPDNVSGSLLYVGI